MLTQQGMYAQLLQAFANDVTENPSILLTQGTPKQLQDILMREAYGALKGEHGVTKFPHFRAAVKDIISEAKGIKWIRAGQIRLGAEPTGTKATSSTVIQQAAPSTLEQVGNFIGSIGNLALGWWTADQNVDLAEDKIEAMNQQTNAMNSMAQAQAQQAQMAQAGMAVRPPTAPGIPVGTLLIVGAVAVGAIFILPKVMGGGRRRR